MDQHTTQRRLGKGISALLGGHGPTGSASDEPQADSPEVDGVEGGELRSVATEKIEPSPFQPRREFDTDELNELVGSVREHGILAPLLVREFADGYQLVAGERRLRAAKKAGLSEVPVRVVDVVDQTACEFALEENLKRTDLNDMEKARAFRRYLDQFQTTQEELAKQLSMSRPAISNLLRLLELPETIQQAIEKGKISSGHAKAILSLDEEADRLALCGAIQADGLSVRKTEAEARRIRETAASTTDSETVENGTEKPASTPVENPHTTSHVRDLESQLRERFGVPVDIRLSSKSKGKIVIPFADNGEFERLMQLLTIAAPETQPQFDAQPQLDAPAEFVEQPMVEQPIQDQQWAA